MARSKVVWTKHALDRAEEYELDNPRRVYLNSHRESMRPGRYNYKLLKYGVQQLDVKYMYTKSFCFVVKEYPKAEVVLTLFRSRK